jgi:hypothetical protein
MASLRELVATGEKRGVVIEHAARVLDAEVADKRGISGMAVKAGYKVVKGVQPGFITKAIDHMLDDFLDALDPIYQEAVEQKQSPRDHLLSNRDRAAEALLGVTDRRAERAKNKLLQKTYYKLRPGAKQHVLAAVPRLGEMVDAHVPAGTD